MYLSEVLNEYKINMKKCNNSQFFLFFSFFLRNDFLLFNIKFDFFECAWHDFRPRISKFSRSKKRFFDEKLDLLKTLIDREYITYRFEWCKKINFEKKIIFLEKWLHFQPLNFLWRLQYNKFRISIRQPFSFVALGEHF